MKRDWTAWMKLMDRTKEIIGIGFDVETGMFQASDEWWDYMELINKSCVKFKNKTLEHREWMEIVFIGAAATGIIGHRGRGLSKITRAVLILFKALVCNHSQIQSLQLVLTWRLSRQWKMLNLRLTLGQKGKGILPQV